MVTNPKTIPAGHSWELNSGPVDHKSDTLTIPQPLHHQDTYKQASEQQTFTLIRVLYEYELHCSLEARRSTYLSFNQ